MTNEILVKIIIVLIVLAVACIAVMCYYIFHDKLRNINTYTAQLKFTKWLKEWGYNYSMEEGIINVHFSNYDLKICTRLLDNYLCRTFFFVDLDINTEKMSPMASLVMNDYLNHWFASGKVIHDDKQHRISCSVDNIKNTKEIEFYFNTMHSAIKSVVDEYHRIEDDVVEAYPIEKENEKNKVGF